jgi:dihydroflavonol-4-reductase
MDGLFQVAAVFRTHARDPQKEIIDPSVIGGRNILEAARRAGVKKVVFTSSIAAVGSDAPTDRPLTEDEWNDDARSPYFIAKTQAERMAWAFAKESGIDLVALNPGAIIGPGFYRHTPSTLSFELLLRGRLPLVLPTGFSFVDVRDVAQAHLLAYENERACGRYLVADEFRSMAQLMRSIEEVCPEVKTPRFVAPRWALGGVAFFDWLAAACLGAPRQVTRAMVAELGGKYQRASSARIRGELGWNPMDFRQSLKDTIEWVRKTFIAKGTSGP